MKKILIIILTFLILLTCASITLGTYIIYKNSNIKKIPDVSIDTDDKTTQTESSVIDKAESYIKKVNGTTFWGVHFHNTDFRYVSDNTKVPSASVIKIFIMEYAYKEIEHGKCTEETLIGNSSLKNLILSMITISDNNATNILIDYFGMDSLNKYFKEQGYINTKLERKMLDTNAMNKGLDNYTSVEDVMNFLDKLYDNKDKTAYKNMLEIMKQQQVKTKIQKNLPPKTVAATKTGELSDVENDIGIIFTPKGDFSIVFLFSSLTDTSGARNTIADISKMFYDYTIR